MELKDWFVPKLIFLKSMYIVFMMHIHHEHFEDSWHLGRGYNGITFTFQIQPLTMEVKEINNVKYLG